MERREFLRWLGAGAGTAVAELGLPLRLLAAADPDQNPLAGSVTREWERIYRDQYAYDRTFDWVCSPNDTHACRVRAFVRNGIVTRLGNTYDYQTYADLYGNHATAAWNPRQCAKGYTFHRVLYGPYRLKHPIVRKGWKAWADAGFPELTDELRTKYLFDSRGQDEFVQISWEDAFHNIAKALVAISTRYSGEEGVKRLLAQGYQPEMVEAAGGAGTRCIKMRGGMGLLGVIGKYGMYRLNNSLALLDAKIRGVDHNE
ncbi:MAG: molybdopterin-dependent oxidoreductase, partial [Candidatus Rokubacteria bacterium]|nr:molybdopterin-dependent oxidoreductase [Candidatus Rokubacteria bacterium]